MKKLLLVISIVSAGISSVNAQSCTPGANYADSTYGVWPDTVVNFPPAEVNIAYSTDLNFKVPAAVTPEIDPSGFLVGSPIQDFSVTDVTGLPVGFSYACNISSCTYAGGVNGCANVYGTTATAGVYPVDIIVDGTILVDPLGTGTFTPVAAPQTTFSGYKILVGYTGTIEAIINPITIHPNPAFDKITLEGLHSQMKISSLHITNMEGKIVKTLNVTSPTMDVNLNSFENGVYFVVVNHAGGTETLKFIKQ